MGIGFDMIVLWGQNSISNDREEEVSERTDMWKSEETYVTVSGTKTWVYRIYFNVDNCFYGTQNSNFRIFFRHIDHSHHQSTSESTSSAEPRDKVCETCETLLIFSRYTGTTPLSINPDHD